MSDWVKSLFTRHWHPSSLQKSTLCGWIAADYCFVPVDRGRHERICRLINGLQFRLLSDELSVSTMACQVMPKLNKCSAIKWDQSNISVRVTIKFKQAVALVSHVLTERLYLKTTLRWLSFIMLGLHSAMGPTGRVTHAWRGIAKFPFKAVHTCHMK